MIIVCDKEGKYEARFRSLEEAIKRLLERVEKTKKEHYLAWQTRARRIILKLWRSGYEITEFHDGKKRRIAYGTGKYVGIGRFMAIVDDHLKRRRRRR